MNGKHFVQIKKDVTWRIISKQKKAVALYRKGWNNRLLGYIIKLYQKNTSDKDVSGKCFPAQKRSEVTVTNTVEGKIHVGNKKNSLEPYGFKRVSLGGESEIRTHGTVLAFTRFPVVRLRPAQPSLRTLVLYHNFFRKSRSFLNFFRNFLNPYFMRWEFYRFGPLFYAKWPFSGLLLTFFIPIFII